MGDYDIFQRADDGDAGAYIGTVRFDSKGNVHVLVDTPLQALHNIFILHPQRNRGTNAVRIFWNLSHHGYFIVLPHAPAQNDH